MFLQDGTRPHPKGKYELEPGQSGILRLPGGGGFFRPEERPLSTVLEDVRQGMVSREAALTEYRVVIKEDLSVVDERATVLLREAHNAE